MRIALIGNPNSGKTALFNELTGASQHVGNWPGVTVEQKRGQIRPQYGSGELIDLPGIYSLSPYSMEEIVSRDFLLNSQPDVVINIIDATNLERNFYLSIQLIELNVPMVMALNMIDEVTAEGYRIDTEQLSIDLGIPVVAISATQRIGIDDLMTALAKAHQPSRHELPDTRLEQLINEVEALFSESLEQSDKPDDAEIFDYPLHWAVIKLLEGDELILQQMQINEQTQSEVNRLVADFESTNGLLSTAIANARYQLIHDLIYQVVTVWDDDSQSGHHHHVLHAPEGYLHEPHHTTDMFSNAHYGEKPEPRPPEAATAYISRSDAIDRVLTNRFLALPVFLLVMFFVFHLTFSSTLFGLPSVPSPGVFLQSIVKYGINMFQVALGPLLQEYPWLQSLVIEGLIGGVGTVLTFIPQILLLFFFLTILEDCGYMARAAFIMDRFLRYFGLSGKSFLPMMMGFGCSVPAIMAARTMENQ
ncbi:MAG: ferrous iron transport protein B, partial [Coriobacteriia bacterium]|nr:ferrous iron transport protein B [Coriobacteriia bacterium]